MLLKVFHQPSRDPSFISKLTLPHRKHSPTQTAEFFAYRGVTPHIPAKFCVPERTPRVRHRGVNTAIVSVPEAPVHEHDCMASRQYYIWFTRKVFAAQREPKPETVQQGTHLPLRACIAPANTTHVPTAALRREAIGTHSVTAIPCVSLAKLPMPGRIQTPSRASKVCSRRPRVGSVSHSTSAQPSCHDGFLGLSRDATIPE
jgi:hypothetical protein